MCAFAGEPGASHRETFPPQVLAAAASGITTIVCRPDTSPAIDNFADGGFPVLRRARGHGGVNIPPMGADQELLGEE